MEPKVNVLAREKEVTVLIGKDVQKLEDHSTFQFQTTDPGSFVEYCKKFGTNGKHVYFGMNEMVLINAALDRYTVSDANCTVRQSEYVSLLEKSLNTPMKLNVMEEFLFTLRPFLNEAGKELYSYVRNFKASKISTISREIDNKGNYNYQVTREKGGTLGDVEIPESIDFDLPAIDALSVDVKQRFTVDIFFDWNDSGDGCIPFFTLKCPLFRSIKESAIQSTLIQYLEPLDCPKFWGGVDKFELDNSWQLVFNGTDK